MSQTTYTEAEAIRAFHEAFIQSDELVAVSIPLANAIGLKEAAFLKIVDDLCLYNRNQKDGSCYSEGQWWTQLSYQSIGQKYACFGSERTLVNLVKGLTSSQLLIKKTSRLKNGGNDSNLYRVNPIAIGTALLQIAEANPNIKLS